MSRAILFVALLVLAPIASADDLPPPPESCPPGSVGYSEHAGQWCVPTICAGEAECGSGEVCREVALCVVEEEYALGGNIPQDPPPRRTRRVARGECIDGACPSGGECRRARRCAAGSDHAPAEEATPETSEEEASEDASDGGCQVAPGPRPAPLALLLSIVLAIAYVRERQARR